jgi:hypothetical protein
VTGPGADERRIRHLLTARGVGYTPQKPPPPSGWWDELYDDAHTDHHPGPDGPPAPAPRLPDWRRGETADLRGEDPEELLPPAKATAPAAVDTVDPDEDDDRWTDATDPDDPAEQSPPDPRAPARASARRATAAYLAIAPRTRTLLYNSTAAGRGYELGLVPLIKGWIVTCGTDTGHISTALLLGTGLVIGAGHFVDRRTRHWWPPLAWACRIPLASALLALALYAPGTL